MNILYICHYAGSVDMGMAFRPYYLAREWKKLGHKVRIVGASFSHLRFKNPIVKKDFEKQIIDGIEYEWIITKSYKGNDIQRALTMWEFCFKLWRKAGEIAKEFQPDLVISSSTYPLDTYPAQKIARIAKAKLIHENHDLWPLTLETIGGMNHYHPFCLAMGMGLRSAIKNSDRIVCLLPYAYEYFQEYGLQDLNKFTHIPNGVVKDDWDKEVELPEEHKKLFLQLQDKFIVGYTGGHALSNALDTFIECAVHIKSEKIAFVLVGKGVEKVQLMTKAQRLGCNNIFFLPPVSKLQIPAVLKMMDVVYVGAEKSALLKYGASLNKVYDYMMAEKPIIYAVDSKNKEVLDADCGWIVEPENSQALASAIEAISHYDFKLLHKKGKNGKNWALNNCEYSILAKQFLDLI